MKSMLMTDEEILSKTITFLRFPLIVAVVFIHTEMTNVVINGQLMVGEGQFPVYDWLFHVISKEVADIAVPLFFFMSGFLFFYRTTFTGKCYLEKLRKRVRTLVVPYVFWNLVVMCLYGMTQWLLSSMMSGNNKQITAYSGMDFLAAFWNLHEGMPICYQLWFLRDLMVVVVFSPVVYGLVRYTKVVGVAVLGALWVFDRWIDVPWVSDTAFFFFAWGAWFSINRRSFTVWAGRIRRPISLLYVALMGTSTWLWHSEAMDNGWIHNLGVMAGLVAIVSWTAYGLEKGRLHVCPFLASSSFFIYAYHGMPASLLLKVWMKAVVPASEWSMVGGYFLIVTVLTGAGIGIYALLHRYLPRFTAVITGGRQVRV